MKSFYLTDTGLVRDHNEDSVIIAENGEGSYLMAVADGMGGHQAGEVASSIAISYLGKRFTSDFRKMSKVDAVSWLRFSVIEINSLIFKCKIAYKKILVLHGNFAKKVAYEKLTKNIY